MLNIFLTFLVFCVFVFHSSQHQLCFRFPNVVPLCHQFRFRAHRHHTILTVSEFLRLRGPVGASDDEAVRVEVVGHQLLQYAERLHAQLPGR